MDRVRFGRALGGGARDAARALLRAADAAAAPNPSGATGEQASRVFPVQPAVAVAPGARDRVPELKRSGRRFGEAVWGPFAKLSGVLWLEFTGVFFGLFAASAGITVWQHRSHLLSAGLGRDRVWLAVAMFVLFGYLTVSSFVRAARRGRR